MSIVYIAVLFFVCMVIYKPGLKFFLLWAAICAAVYFFLNPSAGLWGIIIYFLIGDDGCSEEHSKHVVRSNRYSEDSTYCNMNQSKNHWLTSYNDGEITYYSNGNSSVQYGNVQYFDNNVHSTREGSVTYYFDGNNRPIGRSVDTGNGVHVYFDTNNREIGHSCTSGRITDYIGEFPLS